MIKKIITILTIFIIMMNISINVFALTTTYVPMSVPTNVPTYFKSYMGYHTLSKRSAQYKYIEQWGWVDNEGFLRCNGEFDLGITDNYYMVAMCSYYGREIGAKFKITTDTGNVFYVVMVEFKDDRHTNSTHQYGKKNKDIIEFVVDTKVLDKTVKKYGSANVHMPLNGNIASIERIYFVD